MNRWEVAPPSLLLARTAKSSSASTLSATFNDFLFATVGEERNEMPLSVISALARLDLDPWAEAAALARMPPDDAAKRLSSQLAGVAPTTQLDCSTTAARLVALLPAAETDAAARGRAAGVQISSRGRLAAIMWLIIVVSMVVSLIMGNLAPSRDVTGTITSAARPH